MDPDPVRSSLFGPDPDLNPHRDGENGPGTDQGSIKGSQNKGDKFFLYFSLDL